MLQPLLHKLSSQGILLCSNLQQRKDLEGGTHFNHIVLPQEFGWLIGFRKLKASLKLRSLELECCQTNWSGQGIIGMTVCWISLLIAGNLVAKSSGMDQALSSMKSLSLALRFLHNWGGIWVRSATGCEIHLSDQKLTWEPSPITQEEFQITVCTYPLRAGHIEDFA